AGLDGTPARARSRGRLVEEGLPVDLMDVAGRGADVAGGGGRGGAYHALVHRDVADRGAARDVVVRLEAAGVADRVEDEAEVRQDPDHERRAVDEARRRLRVGRVDPETGRAWG